MNLMIFGPPGAGKGTQSNFIVKKYNLLQLSTGEILRNEIKNKTDLGINISSTMNSGSLVSDEVVSNLIEKFVSKEEYKNRFIFDGYPRNILQAKGFRSLEVSKRLTFDRSLHRREMSDINGSLKLKSLAWCFHGI